jgi:YjbE family integral membrane protein
MAGNHMFDIVSDAWIIAVLQIIAIDIVLGGDNAIIIALACRNLPKNQKRAGILWGTAGAIILRVILVFFATALMEIQGLRLIGGVLLIWIGVKLLTEAGSHDLDDKIDQSSNLLTAIRTIIIADFVMSLDNALAITAAAKGDIGLVIFGLLLSVPIIIGGSALILRLMERFPAIITLGGGLLGWLGGDLIVNDNILALVGFDSLAFNPKIAAVVGAVFVVALGKFIATKNKSPA